MKVLEEKRWSHVTDCKECKSKLEVEAADVRAVEWESNDCDHTSYYAKCPVCYSDLEIKSESLAPGVRDRAIARYRRQKKRGW